MSRRFPTTVFVIAVVATLSLAPAGAHASDASDEPTITWSVRPAGDDGADGRSWMELELDPGESVTEHLVVTNHSTVDVEFRLRSGDGYFTDNGRFNMLPSDAESVGAGTWIELPDAVFVPTGGEVVVPFDISVPVNATPGDHPAGVAASILSSGTGEIGVESRVGFRVMTRVSGDLQPAVALEVAGTFSGSWNPLEPGAIDAKLAVENTGNTRLAVSPTVTATAVFGLVRLSAELEDIAEIAPGETRQLTVRFDDAWPLFWYDVETVALLSTTSDGVISEELEVPPESAEAVVAAPPIPQLVSIALIALLILLFFFERRHKRHDLERRLADAREAGRNEAATRGASDVLVRSIVTLALVGSIVTGTPGLAYAAPHPVDPADGARIEVDVEPSSPRTTVPSSGVQPDWPLTCVYVNRA